MTAYDAARAEAWAQAESRYPRPEQAELRIGFVAGHVAGARWQQEQEPTDVLRPRAVADLAACTGLTPAQVQEALAVIIREQGAGQ